MCINCKNILPCIQFHIHRHLAVIYFVRACVLAIDSISLKECFEYDFDVINSKKIEKKKLVRKIDVSISKEEILPERNISKSYMKLWR